ncbi:DMT family transporter [Roseococcus suduntuyensis]|uniref:Drug/metabolite transporter (DMT)-like permease n=1 Tax=Roseococcus suduntuyensis TaxID=455361 RepID=A0A840AG84_9PROT|nr:DMT family transporter [Roseococcus suduntuyensis]MBB3899902.1 drug/metabolite transporter (DMT)-like permease [Roseococcus suduntuyensis]
MTQARAFQLLLVAVVLFGGVWPITKHALSDSTPLWFGFWRAALAAVATAAVMAALGRLRLPARRDWPAVLALGSLQIGAFFAFTHVAVGMIPSGRTAILSNVTIFWLVPLSVWLLGERVSPMRWVAAGVGLLGVAVMMGPWALDWSAPGVLAGHLWLLCASLAWSVTIIILRRRPPSVPLIELLPIAFLIGAAIVSAVAWVLEPRGGVGASSWWVVFLIGAVAAPIGTWAVSESTRHLNAVVSSLGLLLAPVVGVALATIWLHEPLGWDLLLGGGLVVVSVILATRR